MHKASWQGFRPPQKQGNAHLNLENSSLKKCPKPNGQCPNRGGANLKGASLTEAKFFWCSVGRLVSHKSTKYCKTQKDYPNIVELSKWNHMNITFAVKVYSIQGLLRQSQMLFSSFLSSPTDPNISSQTAEIKNLHSWPHICLIMSTVRCSIPLPTRRSIPSHPSNPSQMAFC